MDIPVILFTYARPDHLRHVLECLRLNAVTLIIAYSDGTKGPADAEKVGEVRTILRAIDWATVELTERSQNLGLGRSVLSGVSEVAARHEAFIVWEDDLICVPGTYAWLCAVLRTYANDERVMSVTAWTHPRVTPRDVGDGPYFDGRAECWVWGTWARAWHGMAEETALTKMAAAKKRGIPANAYGSDLPDMARAEEQRNIWAVRWLYHHLQHGGLCARPPWPMVEHIGSDISASNCAELGWMQQTELRQASLSAIGREDPREHPQCAALWRQVTHNRPIIARTIKYGIRRLVKPSLRRWLRLRFGWQWFRGDYDDWNAASRAAQGYDDRAVLDRVLVATRAVVAGQATWERDGMCFTVPANNEPLLAALRLIAQKRGDGLDVVDFGGALGSTWRQHRTELIKLGPIRWRVVEQLHYIQASVEFTDGVLSFHQTIEEALAGMNDTTVLLSGVLQYIEHPYALLNEVARSGCRFVLLDRTCLALDGRERIVVQHTPPQFGGGSYPCRMLNRERILAELSGYRLVSEWLAFDDLDLRVRFEGLLFMREE